MDFQIGDYVEIEIEDGYYRGDYPSRIIAIMEHRLIILAPRLAGTLVPLKLGAVLIIHVCSNDTRYVFDGRIVELPNESDHLAILLPANIESKQNRRDVRLSIRVPVELLYFYRNGYPVASYTINSIDLSAGGIRIETPEEFKLHTKLKLSVMLPENEEIMAMADVVRTGRLSQPSITNRSWASLRFLNMSDSNKKKILKFIYKQQELRVKGLI
jgi:Predicted glycosyltransferase